MQSDYTSIGGVGQAFLTTHWSQIEASDDPGRSQALIELLLRRYWKPVYCFLRSKGYGNERAKDLTQGFFCDIVLQRDLIRRADRTKGRFRSFLLMALNCYIANVHEAQTARKRTPAGSLIRMDWADLESLPETCSTLTPEDTFTYAWVTALLERALEQVRSQCEQDGRGLYWQVFEDRVVHPILHGGAAPSLETICEQYGISEPATVSNMLTTVKRRFRKALNQCLRESVMSDEEAGAELEEIRRFLPRLAQDGG